MKKIILISTLLFTILCGSIYVFTKNNLITYRKAYKSVNIIESLQGINSLYQQNNTAVPNSIKDLLANNLKSPFDPSNIKQIEVKKNNVTRLYPNIEYRALYTPNDTQQWYTEKIKAPSVWDKTTGSESTTVAVIDTGFALKHDELFDRWATNTAEMGGGKETNGVDDDGNGYVDDWRGWDFYQADNNPNAGSVNTSGSSVSHGTSVAGLVGATGNNSLGVASINWRTKILPLQALSDQGVGYTLTVAQAMHYAVDRGADVISLSLGADTPDDLILDEINYAIAHNVLVVAAAGNGGCDCLLYPANYSGVLSVGATDQNDAVASFSSYGRDLDIVAPGSGSIVSPIYSAANAQNAYSASLYGTSFAAPIASGLAALLKGAAPNATTADIISWIKSSADPLPGGKSGSGRINAYNSLLTAKPDIANNLPVRYMPLYRLYKNDKTYLHTTSSDRQKAGVIEQSYSYDITKYVSY